MSRDALDGDGPTGKFKICYFGLQREASFVEALPRNPHHRILSWSADLAMRDLARIG